MVSFLQMKVCSKCRAEKPETDFYRHSAAPDGLCYWCKGCERARKQTPEYRERNAYAERRAARYKNNTNGFRDRALAAARLRTPAQKRERDLRKYGITPAQVEALLVAQGGRCAICGTSSPRAQQRHAKGPSRGWCVDHCHSTGAVRGVLCSGCNIALGALRDSPLNCMNAATYLAGQ